MSDSPSWYADLQSLKSRADLDLYAGGKPLAEAIAEAAAGNLSCSACGGKLPTPGHKQSCAISRAYAELFQQNQPTTLPPRSLPVKRTKPGPKPKPKASPKAKDFDPVAEGAALLKSGTSLKSAAEIVGMAQTTLRHRLIKAKLYNPRPQKRKSKRKTSITKATKSSLPRPLPRGDGGKFAAKAE